MADALSALAIIVYYHSFRVFIFLAIQSVNMNGGSNPALVSLVLVDRQLGACVLSLRVPITTSYLID